MLGTDTTGGGPGETAATADEPGAALLRLVEVMNTLRVACPWDARQTHESLAPHLLEECYEALEALESGDAAALRDELGDVLLQVVFHARVAAERTDGTGFTIDDVAAGIVDKLTRRHPHVFGDVKVTGPEEVKRNWDAIKATERASARNGSAPASALDSVPFGQPALALAAQLQHRAEQAGAPAELADLRTAPAGDPGAADQPGGGGAGAGGGLADRPGGGDPGAADQPGGGGAGAGGGLADRPGRGDPGAGAAGVPGGGCADSGAGIELGAELFALVAKARKVGLDPESQLRAAARRYADLVRAWERSRG